MKRTPRTPRTDRASEQGQQPDGWDLPEPDRDQVLIDVVPLAKVPKVRGARRTRNR